ncbi:hypothetical protein CAMRE0001_0889 [Campylobacter rectus RM3267]|uniref:Uncharacterized protein n=1 Tax=Campylobacter rectus RM3267 TaxID=553218 RepID=B9D213_CAMRE|nr:hypothetical protein CAMRE0001_0889 [Campylobacter rectus RM3267]
MAEIIVNGRNFGMLHYKNRSANENLTNGKRAFCRPLARLKA